MSKQTAEHKKFSLESWIDLHIRKGMEKSSNGGDGNGNGNGKGIEG